MATKNSIGPECEENQQEPPATQTRCTLTRIFDAVSSAALTPYNTLCRQLQPQEATIRELEAKLNINNSPSDISSNPSDRDSNLGSSNRGNQNNKERVWIEEINLIQRQEEEEVKEDDTNVNENASQGEEEVSERDIDNDSESSEIPFGEEASGDKEEASEVKEVKGEDEHKSQENMLSSSNRQTTGGQGRSARTSRTNPDQLLTYTLNSVTVSFALPTPPTNPLHNVGVVYSRTFRPAHGSDAEWKMVEAIGKNQYSKFK